MQDDHVVVAVEHFAAAPLLLLFHSRQPAVGLALVFEAGCGFFELVKVFFDGQGDQLDFLLWCHRRPLVGFAHHTGVVDGDPPLFGRHQRVRQSAECVGGLGLLAGPMAAQAKLAAQLLDGIVALQITEAAQQGSQITVKLTASRVGLEDQLDHLPRAQFGEFNPLDPQPASLATANIPANTAANRLPASTGPISVFPGEAANIHAHQSTDPGDSFYLNNIEN